MSTRQRGFTLLELAVVLVIISLIAGFGVNIGQNAVKNGTRLTMLEKMALIKTALDNYANRNGYLPCPADPLLRPDNANFGQQSVNFGVEASGCISTAAPYGVQQQGNTWIGMVPTQSLGLDESYAIDAWGNKITYAVSGNHVGLSGNTMGLNSYAEQQGTIIVNSNTLAAPVTLSTNFTGLPGEGATYVVVSHGKDGRGAIGQNATAPGLACTGSTIDVQNCDRSNAVFYDSEYNEGAQTATTFDDYVVWGSNATARTPVNLLPNGCPSSTICEAWCAPCETSGLSAAPTSATRICAKFITRNQPNCEARCIWPAPDRPCP